MLAELERVASELELKAPQIPIVSNLSGEELTEEQATSPAYWAQQARQPVRFADGIAHLREQGVVRFLELGPDATLTALARECLPDAEGGNVRLHPASRAPRADLADHGPRRDARLRRRGRPLLADEDRRPDRAAHLPLPAPALLAAGRPHLRRPPEPRPHLHRAPLPRRLDLPRRRGGARPLGSDLSEEPPLARRPRRRRHRDPAHHRLRRHGDAGRAGGRGGASGRAGHGGADGAAGGRGARRPGGGLRPGAGTSVSTSRSIRGPAPARPTRLGPATPAAFSL